MPFRPLSPYVDMQVDRKYCYGVPKYTIPFVTQRMDPCGEESEDDDSVALNPLPSWDPISIAAVIKETETMGAVVQGFKRLWRQYKAHGFFQNEEDSVYFVGTVMPFSTLLALETSLEKQEKLRAQANRLADAVERGDLICFGDRLGDWPVVRTLDHQSHFLRDGDRVLDRTGAVQYSLREAAPAYVYTAHGYAEHKGVILRQSFYCLAGQNPGENEGWCSRTRTGWPHEASFAVQATEALRRALRVDTSMKPLAP